MANIKISQLPTSSVVAGDDFLPLVKGGSPETQRADFSQVLSYVTSSEFSTLTVQSLTGSNFSSSNAQIGYLDVDTINARVYNSEVINATTIFESGSTQFGNDLLDTHVFTGSVLIEGLIDSQIVSGSIVTGSTAKFTTVSASVVSASIYVGLTGGGDVVAAGNNTFTGINTFNTNYITASVGITGSTAKFTTVSASVVSASTYVGLPSAEITAAGNNTFTGINTFNTNYITASVGITGSTAQFTTVSASVVSASTYVGIDTITPGGIEYSLQFNSGSQLSGSQNLRWDYNTNNLYITGSLFATTKSFDIVHPTKQGMRLRYGSLEGPENGVYVRGKTKQNIVELPDHWTELVHSDTITVNLTPIGSKQDIWVEKIENNTLYIGGLLQECYFTIFGERKDIDKLVVEY